ncbi:hypothetical protein S7711_10056 [Stachybotrys chartarum IBT 7711]|uniref:Enoyl reductase (ER) domain-containing protein n=1 Tax=Stachybotrys chartarum (strain CBS 109288 / IBT 7711) TaxID=1280523 RepID=A0A084AEY6_STACB|nr:hypothetical protein S7711_10056 [Stachybotrys chartarum IBT 7711]
MALDLPSTTGQWVLKRKPEGERVTRDHFSLITSPVFDQPKDGKILVKVLYYSNDPAQRTWMDSGYINERPYLPPVMQEGKKVFSGAIGEVIESYASGFAKGEIVFGHFGWAEYALVDPGFGDPVKKLPPGMSPEDFLCLDLTGQSAYFAFFSRGEATKDLNTVVINNAAGGVGTLLLQFAKSILEIPNVVAICGSDEKCNFVKEQCRADVALNYKSPDFEKEFQEATPNYIDLYMDSVGGRLFDIGLRRIARGGTIVIVGASGQYEREVAVAASSESWCQMWCQRANVLGFLIVDYFAERSQAVEKMIQWVNEGKLKLFRTVYEVSFEDVPDTWKGVLQSGTDSVGKRITKLKW